MSFVTNWGNDIVIRATGDKPMLSWNVYH